MALVRWAGKVAIVTGASSGIGAAIARRLAEEGIKVVGLARRKDRLDSLAKSICSAKGKFYPFQADVTKEEEIIKAFIWVKENLGPVHILINNAGIYRHLPFSDMKTEDAKTVFDSNVLAYTITIREALIIFKQCNIKGHIINMNSLSGHSVIDFPGLGIYTASKYAVTALTEALRLEVKEKKLGTKVTSISPGLVESEIRGEHGNKLENISEILGQSILKAKDIADAVVYILSTPPNCQIDELTITPIYIGE